MGNILALVFGIGLFLLGLAGLFEGPSGGGLVSTALFLGLGSWMSIGVTANIIHGIPLSGTSSASRPVFARSVAVMF